MDAIASVGDNQLIADRRKVGPNRLRTYGDWIRASGRSDVKLIGLGVDHTDRAIALIHHKSAATIRSHNPVDRCDAYVDPARDRVAGDIDSRYLSSAAVVCLTNGVGAGSGSSTGDVNRRVASVDRK